MLNKKDYARQVPKKWWGTIRSCCTIMEFSINNRSI